MMGKHIRCICKILFMIIGALVTINAIYATFVCNMNAGIIANYLLGISLLCYGIVYDILAKKLPVYIRIIYCVGVIAIAIIIPLLFVSGRTDNVNYEEDAIIVLGAAVHGDKVSGALARRLDTAIEYYKQNSDVVIVVTGGQGPQETVTEASAMEKYLVERGIPKTSILMEDKSTSTSENFKYSKALLDEYFSERKLETYYDVNADALNKTTSSMYSVAYITDDYHVYRAGQLAKLAGFEEMTHCHSKTAQSIVLPSGLRECMAIVQLWVFKK